jgi:hypothetical protein
MSGVSDPLATVPHERVNQLSTWVIMGYEKPDDLTSDESQVWDSIAAEVAANPGTTFFPLE